MKDLVYKNNDAVFGDSNDSESELKRQELYKAYKRSFYGERTLLSRIIDTFTFSVLLLLTYYFIVRPKINARLICALLSCILTVITLLISKIISRNRFEGHTRRLRAQIKNEIKRQKLLLLDLNTLHSKLEVIFDKPVWIEQTISSITSDTIYTVARHMRAYNLKSCIIISISSLSDEAAKSLEALTEFDIEHRLAEDIPELTSNITVTENEVDKAILRKYKPHVRRHPDPKLALAPDRIKKYLAMGIMLSLLSMVIPYGIYMRAAASLAFSAAGGLFLRDEFRNRHKQLPSGT